MRQARRHAWAPVWDAQNPCSLGVPGSCCHGHTTGTAHLEARKMSVTQQNCRTICAFVIYFPHHFAASLRYLSANARLIEPGVVGTSQSRVTGPGPVLTLSVTCSATHL